MVNLVAIQKPLVLGLMKMAGIVPHTLEIEPGTTMNIWVPIEAVKKQKKKKKGSYKKCNDEDDEDEKKICKPTKPVVVLVHGFAAEGIATWQFQVGSLTKDYSVYVPDLLFFGGSITDNPDRSPKFQADTLVKGLRKLGIERCTLVGFSYGGMISFKIAEYYPQMVDAMVISGSVLAMTDSISSSTLKDLGFSSSSELLLPNSVQGSKALLKVAAHKNLWFPDRLHKDFLEVMFNNRKERAELLEGVVVNNKEAHIPNFHQRIHLLWGENDQIFKMEYAENMKEQLGKNTTLEGIKKAGHLVHLERPCAYTRCVKRFLDSLHAGDAKK